MIYKSLFAIAAALMTLGAFGGTMAIIDAQQGGNQVLVA